MVSIEQDAEAWDTRWGNPDNKEQVFIILNERKYVDNVVYMCVWYQTGVVFHADFKSVVKIEI